MTTNTETINGVTFSYPKAHGTIQQYAGYIVKEYNKALEQKNNTMASQYSIKISKLVAAGVITEVFYLTSKT